MKNETKAAVPQTTHPEDQPLGAWDDNTPEEKMRILAARIKEYSEELAALAQQQVPGLVPQDSHRIDILDAILRRLPSLEIGFTGMEFVGTDEHGDLSLPAPTLRELLDRLIARHLPGDATQSPTGGAK